MPMSASESETGGKYEGRTIYQFTIRHTTIDTKNRIVYNGQNFEIFEILNSSGRNIELKIKAVVDE